MQLRPVEVALPSVFFSIEPCNSTWLYRADRHREVGRHGIDFEVDSFEVNFIIPDVPLGTKCR